MKNLLYSLFLTATILMLLGSSCKKDPTKHATLPPATQEGKNTVGFTINGEVWVPYYKCEAFSNPCGKISASYGASGGAAPNAFDFQVARIRGDKSSSLTVSSSGIGTITTTGDKIDSIGIHFSAENAHGNDGEFRSSSLGGNSKFIITKIDKINQIVSGVFELVLIETNGTGRTITLKDGRFDFKFNACKCSN